MKGLLPLLCILAALALTGCSVFGGAETPTVEPAVLQPIERPHFTAKTLWRHGIGVGESQSDSGLRPVATDDTVYMAGAKGLISAFRLKDGKALWRARTESRPTGGPGLAGNLVVFGTRDGRVIALNRDDGKRRWTATVSSDVLSAPSGANGVVVVRTEDGRLFGLSAGDGERAWSYDSSVPRLSLHGNSKPLIVGADSVLMAQDNGKLVSLALLDGRLNWEATIAIPSGRSELERLVDLDAGIAVSGGDVFTSSVAEATVAVDLRSGRPIWKRSIGSVTGLAATDGSVYVTDLHGNVWALDAYTGTTLWKQTGLHDRGVTAPVIQDRWVVVADSQGYLHWLSQDDGTFVGRVLAEDDGIAVAPLVVSDERILVLSKEGRLSELQLQMPEDTP